MNKPALFFILTVAALIGFGAIEIKAQSEKFELKFPLGLEPDMYQIPDNNPLTPEKIELGKMLYFEKRLSKDGTVSCATCHDPKKGFTDQSTFSTGINGQKGTRNSPTVINAGYNLFQFWDGRAPSLEEQAKGPIENPVEMGNTHTAVVGNIQKIEGYKPYFKSAFGDDSVTIDRIAQAIASFERTILSGNSAWDRHTQNKDQTALSESAKRGLVLFEGKARCTQCHVGFNLSDGVFHNIGVGMKAEKPDLGRFEQSKQEKDKGAFKTPILRDLLKTAPYMHDGSVKTLEEVIDLYNRGGEPNQWLDPKMKPLDLTKDESADLLEFLKSLEGDVPQVDEPKLPE